MKRGKWLSVLLAAGMALAIMPVPALAANPGELWVNGADITKAQNGTVICGAGTAIYDSGEKILTLNNTTMTTGNLSGRIIDIPDDMELTVILNGENTINGGSGGIYAGGSELTFSGTGSLTINSNNSNGIFSSGMVTVDGAKLNVVTTGGDAVSVDGALDIKNGAKITGNGTYCGVRVKSLSVSGNSTLNAVSSEVNCNALNIWGGHMSVSNSVVEATATSNDAFPAIYTAGGITIENTSTVTAVSNGMRGIYTDGNMSVKNSTVTATGTTWDGMVVRGSFMVDNSKIIAQGCTDPVAPGIVAYGGMNISGESDVLAIGGATAGYYDTTAEAWIGSATISPSAGNLVEVKVGAALDGSDGKHFDKGVSGSPYNTTAVMEGEALSWLSGYQYFHSRTHIHTGGTATCLTGKICTDCEKEYGEADSTSHDWNAAEYTWAEDGKTCTAERTCKRDNTHKETAVVQAEGRQTKAPTCTEKGVTTYTAVFTEEWAAKQSRALSDVAASF